MLFEYIESSLFIKGRFGLDYSVRTSFGQTRLCFQWTNIRQPWDMLVNILYIPFFLHIGSLFRVLANRKEICRLIDLQYNGDLLIGGYSQGGAAALWAHMLLKKYRPKTTVYGAHRVIGLFLLFLNRLLKDVSWVECGNDIVTKIPPLFFRSGKIIHFGPKRKWWRLSFKDHRGYK